jgi:YidC/Oxa1 family membrane protein insertase
MDDQSKNLILATVLSFLVIVVWYALFPPPEPVPPPAEPAAQTAAPAPGADVTAEGAPPAAAGAAPGDAATVAAAAAPRIRIDTPKVAGSISLLGGRIDELALKDYRETIEPGSPTVTLLSPETSNGATFAHFGWGPAAGYSGAMPGPDTLWEQTEGEALAVGAPVTLGWNSPEGLRFTRTVEIDEDYMFTVTDRVENAGAAPASLYAFGVVERHGLPPDLKNFFILHEGAIQVADGVLTEIDYDDMTKATVSVEEGGPAQVTAVAGQGWIGFTDHYWQTILIPSTDRGFTAVAKYFPGADLYRTVARQPVVELAPGAGTEVATRLFAGPKEWETIRRYQNEEGIPKFLDSIDWGWFFFLTKPIFAALHWLNAQIGNMGLAIIALTFIIKAIVFPLARKSYVSMARMKELQPEMEKIKERAGDDRMRLQKEMMELYKKEKVNPAAGCLPILIQIPIFFSLYKVIFVTIELRHAPFFGPFRDLSAPDPTSIMNLFGLLPFDAPEPGTFLALIFLGILPILLGISMWFQQKLNPAPTDPTQAAVFAWMPWIFMFMLAPFASGLLVYWIANNVITFTQQYLIMWSHGHRPDLFGNIRSSFSRKKAAPPPATKKPGGK